METEREANLAQATEMVVEGINYRFDGYDCALIFKKLRNKHIWK